jgi:hypothetical protein
MIIATFGLYIAGAVSGILRLQTGISWKTIIPENDPFMQFADQLEEHYLQYPQPIQVSSISRKRIVFLFLFNH